MRTIKRALAHGQVLKKVGFFRGKQFLLISMIAMLCSCQSAPLRQAETKASSAEELLFSPNPAETGEMPTALHDIRNRSLLLKESSKPTEFGWTEKSTLEEAITELPSELDRLHHVRSSAFAQLGREFDIFKATAHSLQATKPVVIGVLLPLTGVYQSWGTSIQQGLLFGAHTERSGPNVLKDILDFYPSSRGNADDAVNRETIFHWYDTNKEGVLKALQRAQKAGATLIIGPLLKEEVALLELAAPKVPVIALNQPSTTVVSHIQYYGLLPEDEAENAAHHIWYQRKRIPLVVASQTELGQRMAATFCRVWYEKSGLMPSVAYVKGIQELRKQLNKGAVMRLDGDLVSLREFFSLAPVSKASSSFENSIDAIYFIAPRDELLLLKAMVERQLPSGTLVPQFYTSTSILEPTGDLDFRLEMEGLEFSTLPFFAFSEAYPDEFKKLLQKFGYDYFLMRLFAMGMDAYLLATYSDSLTSHPARILKGVTGYLVLNSGERISRTRLPWLAYQKGLTTLIASNASIPLGTGK